MRKVTARWGPLFLIFLLLGLFGCHSSVEKTRSFKTIFDHYRARDGILAIGFPPGLLSLVLNGDDAEQVELAVFQQYQSCRGQPGHLPA